MTHISRRCRQRGLSKVEWIIIVAILLIGGSVVLSMSRKEDAKVRLVEERGAPLIIALERYKSEQGGYPPNLSSLVPRYVTEIPKCSESDAGSIPYFVDEATKSFQIVCPAGMFSKRGFSSASGKWSTFD